MTKTETLIAKLKEKGYVFPTVLQWTADDIDARLRSIALADEIKLMDKLDKIMLLEAFFEEYEDEICEFINQRLEDHLESLTHYNLSEQPF
jgi:hypothetical protein